MSFPVRTIHSFISLAAISTMICFTSAGATPVSGWETAPVDAPMPGSVVETVLPTGESVTESIVRAGEDSPFAPPYQSGWPQIMGVNPNFRPSGVVLADLDGDDTLEVIAGSTDKELYVWRYDGTLMSGWPLNIGAAIQSKAAVADLDGDGDLEIIVSAKSGYIHVLHHDGTPMSGWPKPSGVTGGFRAPTVYDLDGDNVPEIMIGSPSNVNVWHADGSIMSGFPQPVGGNITSTLAVGDITGDGLPEIFAEALNGMLYSFQIDGTVTPGWPVTFGLSNSYAAPSIGDIDGDGLSEVLVAGYETLVVTEVYAYNGDGSIVTGFPLSYPGIQCYCCPVLADGDGDGDLEIWHSAKLSYGFEAFYAWDHTGTLLPGWPVMPQVNLEGSPIVADFDGNPGMEAVIVDNGAPNQVYGFNFDGSVATDFPFSRPGYCGPNSPEVGDIDLDGDLEMALTMGSGHVGVWDFPVNYTEPTTGWGALFHDDWNTNQYGFVVPHETSSIESSESSLTLQPLKACPNPFNPMTEIGFSLAVGSHASLRIYSLTGRCVATLVDGELASGSHSFGWNASDLASGVYLVQLDTAIGCSSLCLVFLR
ncbi:MAG: T9SS type A sorting domain-containing protein [Candidatus Sabulitectum sp.]|nr:T9SS type A sorting domain-containing protein [Candidatus Sabulitectum sp.]